jgi:acyl-CoA synthetase (AMP-forming)/AMP-acid ligase II
MFSSYYKNKTLYKNYFYKDFFLTGDLGFRDFEGFHYLVDRKKNIIIKGGVNIEPEEINEVLLESKNVENAVTVGIPDKFYGEDIVSFIIPKKNFINLDKIKTFCISRLGEFKSPKEINIVNAFPVGPSGKILLRVIKENYLKQK